MGKSLYTEMVPRQVMCALCHPRSYVWAAAGDGWGPEVCQYVTEGPPALLWFVEAEVLLHVGEGPPARSWLVEAEVFLHVGEGPKTRH